MAFSRSSTDIKLEGSHLKARCKDRAGRYQDSAIELNNYIENIDGLLKWQPNGNFIANSRDVVLKGPMLECQSKTRNGAWRYTSINLDEKIFNYNGKLIYKFEHAIIKVDKNNKKEVMNYITDIYKEHKASVNVQAADMPGGSKVLYINAGAGKDEGIIMQVSAEVSASIFHHVSGYGGIETASFDVLQTKAKAWASQVGIGVGLSANLINANASVFDLTLGVGVDTGVGIKDDSFTAEVLGCGITLGRKVGISVLGSSFGVDFGRCSLQ